MTIHKTFATGVFALALLGLARPVFADGAETEADRLFNDAVRAHEAGQTEKACALFEASYRAREGTGTLLNLAACHEKRREPWKAYNEFSLAATRAAMAGQSERVGTARGRATELEKEVVRVQLTGALDWVQQVVVDGAVPPWIGVSAKDPFAVAPGKRVVLTISGNRRSITRDVEGKPGEYRIVDIAPGAGEPASAPVAGGAPEGAPTGEGGRSTTLPLVLLGLGATGIVVGSVTGIMALGKGDEYNAEAKGAGCTEQNRTCPSDAAAAAVNNGGTRSSAQNLATVSTISFIIGGLAAAVGVTLLALPSKASASSASTERPRVVPSAGPAGAGITLLGTF
jgi:hypothetical protein